MELLSRERRTKMQVIDRRGQKLTTTFGDLALGEAFTDTDGDINIKVGLGCTMYWDGGQWIDRHIDDDLLIIPLEVTYTFEREGGRK
jgi:hypothetical protein